jgi:hypothetical protein
MHKDLSHPESEETMAWEAPLPNDKFISTLGAF